MNDPTESLTNAVRMLMVHVARFLNRITRGKLRPAHITILSLLGHVPVAYFLWEGRPIRAAVCLAFFGLMDALDGALAREQKTASKFGMFFDAVTDRIKEIIVFSALTVFVYSQWGYFAGYGTMPLWTIPVAVGTSLLVSYVKAKGEMAVAAGMHDRQALNRAFSQGIARYEIRTALLITGLITGLLPSMLNVIIAFNLATVAMRFQEVARLLHVEDAKARKAQK